MTTAAPTAPTTAGFRVTLSYALTGERPTVDAAVARIARRVRWMDSVRERYGAVQLRANRAELMAEVTVTANPPLRDSVRTAAGARLMVESALENELRSSDSVQVRLLGSTSGERS